MPADPHPTAYPDVNALLDALLAEVRAALGEQFAGMYLYGSLASGDFDPATSDVDFLVITDGPLGEPTIAALAAMHARIATSGMKWAAKLEGAYLASGALPRYNPVGQTAWPTLNEGRFYLAPHGWDWVIQRHVLREHGVVLAGPPIRPLIDPVSPAQLRRAVRELLREWWAPMLTTPDRLATDEYQAYAILSMCRALHALEHGTIVSKPQAARWAQQRLGEPWPSAIERALAWRPGGQLAELPAALGLIRYALAAAKAIHSAQEEQKGLSMNDLNTVAPAFVAMAHQIVWCSVATVDAKGRPRSRILHPIWEWDGERLVGWIATSPTPSKRAHLAASPFASLSYWAPSHDTCVADCRATWAFDDATRTAVWDRFLHGPPPVGYNPAIVPAWTSPTAEAFAVLRLEPWRLRVFPSSVLLGQGGAVLTWHE